MFFSSRCLLENQYEPFWSQEQYIKLLAQAAEWCSLEMNTLLVKILNITEQEINLLFFVVFLLKIQS